MTRGLTSTQIQFLEDNVTVSELLIQLSYGSNNFFYTTGLSNIDTSTDVSGGTQTYTVDHNITGISEINEVPFQRKNRASLIFQGTNTFSGTDITDLPLSTTIVYVHRIFRSTSDYSLWTESPIKIFQGVLNKHTVLYSANLHETQLDFIGINKLLDYSSRISFRGIGIL